MSRSESFHEGIKFSYHSPDMGISMHRIKAETAEGEYIGHMAWNRRHVTSIEVDPQYRRQGIASEMWRWGHAAANTYQRVPKPKHSADRTFSGDAWARAVGGPLPRRLQFKASSAGDWEPA